jgi:hypothetical protein
MTSLHLWFKIIQCINNDDDARPYEPCADRLYQLISDEGGYSLYHWWNTFWGIVAMKYPNVAANHISQFLHEVIDRKQFSLVTILGVSFSVHSFCREMSLTNIF